MRPDLVKMERVIDETDFIATPAYYMDWVEGGALVANPPWDDDTASGAYGAGSLATAANGKGSSVEWAHVILNERSEVKNLPSRVLQTAFWGTLRSHRSLRVTCWPTFYR